MSASKYMYLVEGIKRLEPGEGIVFYVDKPWGLATYIYRTCRKKDKTIKVRISMKKHTVHVWRDMKWKHVKVKG